MRSTDGTIGDKAWTNFVPLYSSSENHAVMSAHIRQKKARIANVGARFIVAPFYALINCLLLHPHNVNYCMLHKARCPHIPYYSHTLSLRLQAAYSDAQSPFVWCCERLEVSVCLFLIPQSFLLLSNSNTASIVIGLRDSTEYRSFAFS